MNDFIYLASQSPRRRQLLDQMGVPHQLLLADVHEDSEALEVALAGELPADYVRRVTGLKLDAAVTRFARRRLPMAPILCADTTVALGRQILGKPRDAKDATQMLRKLSQATHRVITAVAVAAGDEQLMTLSESLVTFGELSDRQIDTYVASGEPMDKAGAYAVQGRAGMFVARIEGSYSGIMGLPMYETAQLLRAAGFAP